MFKYSSKRLTNDGRQVYTYIKGIHTATLEKIRPGLWALRVNNKYPEKITHLTRKAGVIYANNKIL